jgi:LysR family hydrogen peroxide-inducible transcriptional activator
VLLVPLMSRALRAAEDVQAQAEQLRDPLAGAVRVGAFPTLAPYALPYLMPRLGEAMPKLRVELIEEKTETLISQLLEGRLDAALLALPITHPRLDAIALFSEPFLLAVASTHPLAKRKSATIEDLATQPLLLLDEGHCLREQSLEFCTRIGKGESQSYRATSLETLRHMVASGAGVTLMPQLAKAAGDGIAYLPFTGADPHRQIALVFRSATGRRLLFGRMAREIRVAMKPVHGLKLLAASAT